MYDANAKLMIVNLAGSFSNLLTLAKNEAGAVLFIRTMHAARRVANGKKATPEFIAAVNAIDKYNRECMSKFVAGVTVVCSSIGANDTEGEANAQAV